MTRIGVMGGGAIGCLYGGWLAKSGAHLTIVARSRHVEAMRAHGLHLTGRDFDFHIPVTASVEPSALSDCDLILFCTKTRDTESVASQLAPILSPGAIVLSFQNGVDGAERLASILPRTVFSAALFVSCQMEGPGHVKHNGRGDIILGDWFADRPEAATRRLQLDAIAATLQRGSIEVSISDDIKKTLWTKLAMNCGYNAVSALGRARYERVVASAASHELMRQVVEELVAVAKADSVVLSFDSVFAQVLSLGTSMGRAISSTGQDIAAGRLTEIDDLNGYVVRRGKALGVPAPVNETLQRLVRLLEEAPVDPAFFLGTG
ncbi:MAG: ketopantoate reductase family protein [Vicinamibacteria bacterium]